MKALISQPDKRKKTAGSFRFLLLKRDSSVGAGLPASQLDTVCQSHRNRGQARACVGSVLFYGANGSSRLCCVFA